MILSPLTAILDANVLLPPSLSDLLLRLAEDPAVYRPRWTAEILDEVQRNQILLGWPTKLVGSWRSAVEHAFPGAMITGSVRLLPVCTNHPSDRHVLAAALKADCRTIVTSNLKHFAQPDLSPHGVQAVAPDQFLSDLAMANPSVVCAKFREAAEARSREIEQNLAHYAKYLPRFSQIMRVMLDSHPHTSS